MTFGKGSAIIASHFVSIVLWVVVVLPITATADFTTPE